jgi:hypothetical protein
MKTTPEMDTEQAKVCEYIATLGLSARRAAEKAGVNVHTFMFRCDKVDEYAVQYARSIKARADFLAEQAIDIVDSEPERNQYGGIDNAHVNLLRLRYDARKWYTSKLHPSKYSDRVDVTSDGKALPQPPQEILFRVAEQKQ